MAYIQNDRDILLQAAAVRVVPVLIPIEKVEGLEGVISDINTDISSVGSLASGIRITSTDTAFTKGSGGATTPASISLTAQLNGLQGTVTWSIVAGSATLAPSGNTCNIIGSSVSGYSVTVKATLGTYSAQMTITKMGALSAQDTVNLTSQVTGQLASGNVTGLGALALLNTVNLNTQTVGALNGQTQVTNLGTLAYANAIAANQIGAGTLAAGVIYAGTINADKITGNTITGTNGIQILGSGGQVLAGIYKSENSGFLFCQGYTNLSASSGQSVLYYPGSGSVTLAQGLPLEIGASSLSGSMGSRILLKNVTYNITINGTTNSTMKVNS